MEDESTSRFFGQDKSTFSPLIDFDGNIGQSSTPNLISDVKILHERVVKWYVVCQTAIRQADKAALINASKGYQAKADALQSLIIDRQNILDLYSEEYGELDDIRLLTMKRVMEINEALARLSLSSEEERMPALLPSALPVKTCSLDGSRKSERTLISNVSRGSSAASRKEIVDAFVAKQEAQSKLQRISEEIKLTNALHKIESERRLLDTKYQLQNADAKYKFMNKLRSGESTPRPADNDLLPDMPANATLRDKIGLSDDPRSQPFAPQNGNPGILPSIARAVGEGLTLPKTEHLTFDGNPTEFHSFIHHFKSHMECRTQSKEMRLTLLLQQCRGRAKDLISHCSILDSGEGYAKARELLYSRFGTPRIVATAFVAKLNARPDLKAEDATGVHEFALLLQKCQMVLAKVDALTDVSTVERICSLARKLPFESQKRWRRKVSKIIRETRNEPNFDEFVKFVEAEAHVLNTYKGLICVAKQSDKRQAPVTTNRRAATCAIVEQRTSTGARMISCYCCKGNHHLNKCETFMQRSITARREFLRSQGLCENCLGSHSLACCQRPSACRVRECQMRHHTILHDEHSSSTQPRHSPNVEVPQEREPEQRSSSLTVGQKGFAYYCVVPVTVSFQNRKCDTYALIDNGSCISFITESLVRQLDATGTTEHVCYDTVGSHVKSSHSMCIDLSVTALNGGEKLNISKAATVSHLPARPNERLTTSDLKKLPHLRGLEFPQITSEVTLLIGTDVPFAHHVLEQRTGKKDQAFAVKTPLGWSLLGPMSRCSVNRSSSRAQVSHVFNVGMDFRMNPGDLDFPTSVEDRKVLSLMHASKEHKNGHYYLPLPWRSGVELPENSERMAESRLKSLEKRLRRDEALKKAYIDKITTYVDEGFAEAIPPTDVNVNEVEWFLPHHPVLNPRKPGKLRVVFDCAAQHKGLSLNDALLQGPDLMNSLVSVLTRFRLNKVAMVADVEAMFHQVRVKGNDINALKFLWWPNGDMTKAPVPYRMLVHIFGAKSSPSCACFALQQTAQDYGDAFDSEVSQIVKQNFYVDDCLFSTDTAERAISLMTQLRGIMMKGGFRLTKWLSNHKEVIDQIPESERANSVVSFCAQVESNERVLGVQWAVADDSFSFKASDIMAGRAYTRRNLLSAVNSLFDPLGFVAPVVLIARMLQQELLKKNLDWDCVLQSDDIDEWVCWFEQLSGLKELSLPRCVKPQDFGIVKSYQLHHFSDASMLALGTVSYLRLVDENGCTHCAFLCGKSRVTPAKSESIPRLELVAAVLATESDRWLKKHLDLPGCESIFWTDSCAVRLSIRNESKRFTPFVANRLAKIHRQSRPEQWRHVGTRQNPADYASRGMSVSKLLKSRWLLGPKFIWEDESHWPTPPERRDETALPNEFKPMERKRFCGNVVQQKQGVIDDILARYSNLSKLKRSVAWLLRFKSFLRSKETVKKGRITIQEMRNAETVLIKHVQAQEFEPVIQILENRQDVNENLLRRKLKRSQQAKSLSKLTPQLVEGVLRVGGRLQNASLDFEVKYPIILPCNNHLTSLFIRHHHEISGHAGISHTWTSLRQRLWVLKGCAAVRKELKQCIPCRKRSAPRGKQIMAELPSARLKSNMPPFSAVGIDCFGPFLVKQGRSEVKRYGCVFTCLTMRAVHLEVVHDMSADSFANAFRRFIARRGKPVEVRSDCGTNFVAVQRAFQRCFDRFQNTDVFRKLEIEWKFNPPTASHFGGAWERLIKSVRRIMSTMITKFGKLNDDMLHTLMTEVENIINSRPLIPVKFGSVDQQPLTPNHLLRHDTSRPINAEVISTSPSDVYSRQQWKRVQYLADEFWRRWTKEFLPTLSPRQRWPDKSVNFKSGDIVLLVEETILVNDGLWAALCRHTPTNMVWCARSTFVFLRAS